MVYNQDRLYSSSADYQIIYCIIIIALSRSATVNIKEKNILNGSKKLYFHKIKENTNFNPKKAPGLDLVFVGLYL